MGSFIGLHLPVLMEVLIFMIQYTVIPLEVLKFSSHRFIRQRLRMKSLFMEVPAVQQQNGGSDCGLLAIAFAYHAGIILPDKICFTFYSCSYNVLIL